MFEASGSFHFDISTVYNTTMKDLHLDSIRDYFLKYNMFDLNEEEHETVERILINADMMKVGSEVSLCTVGGLLFFGKSPADKLPQQGASFAHFNGLDITEDLIDKKIIMARLSDVAEQTLVTIYKP